MENLDFDIQGRIPVGAQNPLEITNLTDLGGTEPPIRLCLHPYLHVVPLDTTFFMNYYSIVV